MAYIPFLESLDVSFPLARALAVRYGAAFKAPWAPTDRPLQRKWPVVVRQHGYRRSFVCNICGLGLKSMSQAHDRTSKHDRARMILHLRAHEDGYIGPCGHDECDAVPDLARACVERAQQKGGRYA